MPGVIFDWDGVIIDSHDQHHQSWERWAAEMGRELPETHMKDTFGLRNDRIIGDYLGWIDANDDIALQSAGERKEELYREIIRETGIGKSGD